MILIHICVANMFNNKAMEIYSGLETCKVPEMSIEVANRINKRKILFLRRGFETADEFGRRKI